VYSTEPLADRGKKYIVAVRPLTFEGVYVKERIAESGYDFFLDSVTLLDRLTGFGPRVLYQTRNSDKAARAEEDARRLGAETATFDGDSLLEVEKPILVKSACFEEGRLQLMDRSGIPKFAGRGESCLIVLGCKDPSSLLRKRMARLSQLKVDVLTFKEAKGAFMKNTPVIDLYIPGCPAPFRIEGDRFNFNSLGADKAYAMSLNMNLIFSRLFESFEKPLVDTSFGEIEHPVNASISGIKGDSVMVPFSLHSRFVHTCVEKGMFRNEGREGVSGTGVDPIPGLNVAWISPSHMTGRNAGYLNGDGDFSLLELEGKKLPSPPVSPRISRNNSIFKPFLIGIIQRMFVSKGASLPLSRGIYYFLSFLSIGSIIFFRVSRERAALAVASLSGMLLFFLLAFALLKLKREVENVPTAKVRSLAMGPVELKGRGRQKYALRSPYSGTECIYYSYSVLEERGPGGIKGTRLVEQGDSGPVPFYLEDDTGKVLVVPEGAYIDGGVTQTFRGMDMAALMGARGRLQDGSRVTEKLIPVGSEIYLLGFAKPAISGSREREMILREKLKKIRGDRESLKEFDLDGDGKIDGMEWDMGRENISREILLSDLDEGDRLVVTAPPPGGAFYIGDREEKGITRKMAVKGWSCLLVSLILLALSVYISMGIL
jgi:hypothetical protein